MQKVVIYGAIVLALPVGFVIWLVLPSGNQGQTASASLSQARANSGIGSDSKSTAEADPAKKTPAAISDVEHKKLIIGKWKTERGGTRILTVSDDGIAVIDAEIDGFFKQKLFGKKLRIDLTWDIQDAHVYMKCTGGEPSWAINAFTKFYGTERNQPILNLDEKQLLLKDDADDPDHDYERISG